MGRYLNFFPTYLDRRTLRKKWRQAKGEVKEKKKGEVKDGTYLGEKYRQLTYWQGHSTICSPAHNKGGGTKKFNERKIAEMERDGTPRGGGETGRDLPRRRRREENIRSDQKKMAP